MPKADKQATAAKHFQDPGSFVFKDKREWLAGEDWKARKLELWERCGGRCEKRTSLRHRCKEEAHHPHHIIKKSIAHDDRLLNLIGLCERHHRLMHPEKQVQKLTKGLTEAQILGLEPR